MENNNTYFLPIAVLAAGLLIAGAVVYNGSRPTTDTGTAQAVDVKDIKLEGNPFIGDPNAPLTMAFWSDYQCPYCKAVETGGVPQIQTPAAMPDIIKSYVDTGKVKIVFMDFAFLGNDSITVAEYGRAIWKLYPDKYFEWRTAAFMAQDEEGDKGFGDAASVDKLNATIAGIDAAKVAADVKENKATYDALIQADRAEGVKAGVQSTPSSLVGNQLIVGAYPFANFQSAIEAQIK